jgi:hypothetical protein
LMFLKVCRIKPLHTTVASTHVSQDDNIVVLKQEQENEGLHLVCVFQRYSCTDSTALAGLLRGRRGLLPRRRHTLLLKAEEIRNNKTIILRFCQITHSRWRLAHLPTCHHPFPAPSSPSHTTSTSTYGIHL